MTTGKIVRVKSRNGFEFDAWCVAAQGKRRGGVIVVQEIFGLSDHIKHMAERFAEQGYEALAPSMFDRAAPGFVAQPHEVAEYMAKGRDLAVNNGPDNAMKDIGGCLDRLKQGGAANFITGYCYGGTMSWLAAARIAGLAAASCYYGGNIPQMTDQKPMCPTICHFGRNDPHIPMEGVEKVKAAHPDVPVYVYEAGHGFARKGSADYDAASDKLAFERTIELFNSHSA
jgi:carboxymethylenebutenolidase